MDFVIDQYEVMLHKENSKLGVYRTQGRKVKAWFSMRRIRKIERLLDKYYKRKRVT